MKYKHLFVVCICMSVLLSKISGQNLGVYSGVIVDSVTNKPIEFASVNLIRVTDSVAVTGAMTDAKGNVEINDVPFGKYFAKISSVGYLTEKTKSFLVDSKNKLIRAGNILLKTTDINMDEVAVSSQKIMMNNSIDRKVYNVQMDVMSKTGTASDLLQNIPSVQVDIDGNVSLRGSSSVLILINGKTSPLMGKTRADVLQQMPANSIEKIEVITNPSAKYKPDGTSGIINIVMKKEVATGLNGNITASVGNQQRYNSNASFNYKPGSVNYFGSVSLRQDDRNSTSTDIRTQYDDTQNVTNYYNDNSRSNSRPLSRGAVLGFDYNVDQSNSFGVTGNYFYRGFTRNDFSTKVWKDQNNIITSDYDRSRYDPEYEIESDINAYYQHNFQGNDHKIRMEVNQSFSPEVEDNHYQNTYRLPAVTQEFDNNLVKQDDYKTQMVVEYSNSFSDKETFEAGYNGELTKRDMDYYGENFDPVKNMFVTDVVRTNHFIYNENLHALFATYSNTFGSFGMLAGLRAEGSFIDANLVSLSQTITNNYYNIYPTLHLSYKLSEMTQVQLNYSKRAHRPEGDDLNPFSEYQDPRNIRAGNPNLKPEFIHSVEFGIQWQTDYLTVLPSVFYRNRYNGMTSITKALNDTTLLTTKENLSSDESAGFEIVFSGSYGKLLTANLSGNAFYETIDASNLGFGNNKSTVTWSGNLSCNINLSSTTMLQFNSNYRSARLTPQGESKPSYVVNLGFRQDLLEDRLSLVFTISDIFKTQNRDMNFDTSWLKQASTNYRDSQVMYLGVTYHLGKPSKKAKKNHFNMIIDMRTNKYVLFD